jgi:virginiamycin B lyase
VTDGHGAARPQRDARLRTAMLAAAVTGTALLAAACGGGSPASSLLACGSGYLYWANIRGPAPIGRARLDGTDVNQKFITGAAAPGMIAVSSGYLYWANWGSGTIGHARLNGTGVSQGFLSVHGHPRGVAVVDPRR